MIQLISRLFFSRNMNQLRKRFLKTSVYAASICLSSVLACTSVNAMLGGEKENLSSDSWGSWHRCRLRFPKEWTERAVWKEPKLDIFFSDQIPEKDVTSAEWLHPRKGYGSKLKTGIWALWPLMVKSVQLTWNVTKKESDLTTSPPATANSKLTVTPTLVLNPLLGLQGALDYINPDWDIEKECLIRFPKDFFTSGTQQAPEIKVKNLTQLEAKTRLKWPQDKDAQTALISSLKPQNSQKDRKRENDA